MRPKAIDLFHAYTEHLIPSLGATLVAARDEGPQAPLLFFIADFSSISSIDCSVDGLTFAAEGLRLDWRIDPNAAASPFPIEGSPFSGRRALFVRRPCGRDFSFLFPPHPDMHDRIRNFLAGTFRAELHSPQDAAETAADCILAHWASFGKGLV